MTVARFFIRCVTFLSSLLTISCLLHSYVGVIRGIFVCASWGLRATDCMISVVAGPDSTGSITPHDSAWSGLRSKWTGTALRVCPSNTSLRPAAWAEGGSSYCLTYSGFSSQRKLARGLPNAPVLTPLAYLAAAALWPHAICWHRQLPSTPSELGLCPGLFAPVGGGLLTPATAATMGLPAPGLGTPAFSNFPPTPRSPLSGLAAPPTPRDMGKKDD